MIDQSKDIYEGFGKIEPRLKQTFNSFVSLFKNDKKQLKKFDDFVKAKQEEIIDERRNSFAGEVIEGIHKLILKGEVNINNKDIITEAGLTDFKGQNMKPRGLTSILKSLGFQKAKMVRLEGEIKRCIPLEKNHLDQLFERYGLCNDVTIVTIVTESPELKEYIENNPCVTVGGLPTRTVTTVTTVTEDIAETTKTDDDLIIILQKFKAKNKSGYPKQDLAKKYGENRIKKLIMYGLAFEQPSGFINST